MSRKTAIDSCRRLAARADGFKHEGHEGRHRPLPRNAAGET